MKKDDTKYLLGRLMGMAGRVLKVRLEKNLAEAGIDLPAEQAILLKILADKEGVNQQDLTFHMFCDKTAITRWIDALEEKKLVVRKPDKVDRRQNLLFPTKKGKALVAKIIRVALKTDGEAMQGIDPKKVEICREVLIQARRNLEE
jgi:MarR family transcriptional regulator, organic hydroperoxide resistance regulator